MYTVAGIFLQPTGVRTGRPRACTCFLPVVSKTLRLMCSHVCTRASFMYPLLEPPTLQPSTLFLKHRYASLKGALFVRCPHTAGQRPRNTTFRLRDPLVTFLLMTKPSQHVSRQTKCAQASKYLAQRPAFRGTPPSTCTHIDASVCSKKADPPLTAWKSQRNHILYAHTGWPAGRSDGSDSQRVGISCWNTG